MLEELLLFTHFSRLFHIFTSNTVIHLNFNVVLVYVRDMKAVDIDTMSWEGLAADRTKWRNALKQHLKTGEDKLLDAAADKQARDAATTQQEINQIKNKNFRMYHPWSSLTDRCLYEFLHRNN